MRQAARTADRSGDPVRTQFPDPGSSATGPAHRWLSQVPYLVVLAGVAAGLTVIRQGPAAVRSGALIIAGALLLAALARVLLPDQRVGLLAARPRRWDVAALAALGIGLLVAGLIYPVPS